MGSHLDESGRCTRAHRTNHVGNQFPRPGRTVLPASVGLSYSLSYAVFGLNGAAWHLSDVLLHLSATLCLYATRRLARAPHVAGRHLVPRPSRFTQ